MKVHVSLTGNGTRDLGHRLVGPDASAMHNARRIANDLMRSYSPYRYGAVVAIHRGDGWRAREACRWTYEAGGWKRERGCESAEAF
jgi:hypothetical protein